MIAVPTQILSAPLIIASSKGLFREAGVAVTNQPFALGIDALNSLLAGKSDLAVVADVPSMFSLVCGDDIAILAGISQARRTIAVVARRDRDIHAVKDLAGKTVGLTLGTNLGYFLDALLQANDTPSSSVRLQNMKTNETLDALQAGKIDAAVVFQPNLARLQAQMGEQLSVFYGEDVYAFRFLLVGRAPYIDAHPQEIQRILSALVTANRFIRKDPVAAREIVGRAVQIADETMAKIFDTNEYDISLNQAMLLASGRRNALGDAKRPSQACPHARLSKPNEVSSA